MDDSLERIIEHRVAELGFEFVELERAGSRHRPILRLRIDLPDAEPGHGITIDECAIVSRAIEAFLDSDPAVAERYVLEVSSPGIERPLVRRRDYERYAGRAIAVSGHDLLEGNHRRLEGTLEGIAGEGEEERILLRMADGIVHEVPRSRVTRAHLVFRWPAGGD
ncbi:MAG: ribosome maturation factor RimP [Longimicrobiales bacterium]